MGDAGTGEPSGIFNDPISVNHERNVDELIHLSLEEQTDKIINFSGVLNTTDEILNSAVNQSGTLGTFKEMGPDLNAKLDNLKINDALVDSSYDLKQ